MGENQASYTYNGSGLLSTREARYHAHILRRTMMRLESGELSINPANGPMTFDEAALANADLAVWNANRYGYPKGW